VILRTENLSMEHWWSVTENGKPKHPEQKPVPAPLHPTRISHSTSLESNPDLYSERQLAMTWPFLHSLLTSSVFCVVTRRKVV
jgi:hypothetical protein